MPKTARVGRLGHAVTGEVAFPEKATIDDALAHFGEEVAKGESLAIDGEPVTGKDEFDNGDTIFIVPSTTGA